MEQYDWLWILHRPWFTLQPRLLYWRTSSMDEKCEGCKHGTIFLLGDFSKGQGSWATSNHRTWDLTSKYSNLRVFSYFDLPSCMSNQPLPQSILVLGWNSSPTNALLHRSLNLALITTISPSWRSSSKFDVETLNACNVLMKAPPNITRYWLCDILRAIYIRERFTMLDSLKPFFSQLDHHVGITCYCTKNTTF